MILRILEPGPLILLILHKKSFSKDFARIRCLISLQLWWWIYSMMLRWRVCEVLISVTVFSHFQLCIFCRFFLNLFQKPRPWQIQLYSWLPTSCWTLKSRSLYLLGFLASMIWWCCHPGWHHCITSRSCSGLPNQDSILRWYGQPFPHNGGVFSINHCFRWVIIPFLGHFSTKLLADHL